MKATEIVRRIDDLGSMVIPKEIRRALLIRVSALLLMTLKISTFCWTVHSLTKRTTAE